MSLSVVIPTMPDRQRMAQALAVEVWNRMKFATVTVSAHEHSKLDTVNALMRGLAVDPDAEWFLYLEDDVQLSPDWEHVLVAVLASEPETTALLSFFSLRDLPDGFHTIRKLVMAQCVALRPRVLKGRDLHAYARDWYARRPDHFHAADFLLGDLAAPFGTLKVYCPSIVQHRRVRSSFKGRSTTRQSPTYSRVYGEVLE